MVRVTVSPSDPLLLARLAGMAAIVAREPRRVQADLRDVPRGGRVRARPGGSKSREIPRDISSWWRAGFELVGGVW